MTAFSNTIAHLVAPGERLAAVVNVLRESDSQRAIVFCTTREGGSVSPETKVNTPAPRKKCRTGGKRGNSFRGCRLGPSAAIQGTMGTTLIR